MQGQTASYVLTSLVSAPASSALTTLDAIRDELGFKATETDNDAWLSNRAIPQASADIARYCSRVFGLATWQDQFRPQRGVWGEGVRAPNNPLMLTKFPVLADVVSFTGNTYSTNKIDGFPLSIGEQLENGMLLSGPGIAAGTTITLAAGTFIMLSAPTLASTTGVKLSTGVSVVETVAGVDTGLTAGTDFELEQGSRLVGDEGVSRIYRLNQQGNPRTWPAGKITVVYQAGYALPSDNDRDLPDDIEEACLRLIVGRFRAKGRDPMLVERSQPGGVGTDRYWVGGSPGQKGALPPEIEDLVSRYRTPVTA